MNEDRASQFIEAWGRMGSLWGINPSTARVQALLLSSAESLGLDDISERLRISRGNASMCLKELRNWEVVRLVKKPGDRKDYYVCEPDVWKTLFAIARGRKRRELDPAVAAVREAVAGLSEEDGVVAGRLSEFSELLGTLSGIAGRLLVDEDQARTVLEFLARAK
jgi:DNA-binding transcriptional regulator GbsR (MarR family)